MGEGIFRFPYKGSRYGKCLDFREMTFSCFENKKHAKCNKINLDWVLILRIKYILIHSDFLALFRYLSVAPLGREKLGILALF